jgi:pantothenate kinase type III
MQGLITIDFGNTRPNCGLFVKSKSGWELKKRVLWDDLRPELSTFGLNPTNTSSVLCEVHPRENELLAHFEEGFLLTRIKDYWRGERFAGMPVHYAKTLGEDRLIFAHYAYKTEKCSTLLIDAGTFTTIDLVTKHGFQGGYIVPGETEYFASFARGEQLKDVSLQTEISADLPQTTLSAMARSYGAFGELVKSLVKKHQIERILITGGAGQYWSDLLSDLPQVRPEPDALHWAIHHWFTTQIEPA